MRTEKHSVEEKRQLQAALPAGEKKGREENEAQRGAKRSAVNHMLFQVHKAKVWHKILITDW